MMRWAALLASAALVVAACGAPAHPPVGSVVSSYLGALGEGNYANACGLLNQSARSSLDSRFGRHASCPKVIARCLPNEATAFSRDQTQQLYANIDLSVAGTTAVAKVSGTAVAKTVKTVTLIQRRGIWTLATPGTSLERCHRQKRTR